ncbi:hypothetical protein CYLTODRAFT_449260 [Cylindrobasidium torrendii FP15055 ss-10]|uniref:Uncharacterized protein n=1 Tax=Cylindrobasidium torrendii FP15055 ss-10 TaxID=1314674 RepID=A0A0D7BRJ2_9AGAR|nr:hypothetical protein CYLTODRAFT_449260 [Cylindrobasidium torrendii FP15055 ss-10]
MDNHDVPLATQEAIVFDFMKTDGFPIPSLQEMEAELNKPDNLAEVESKIQKLEEYHKRNMDRLFSTHTREYESLSRAHEQSINLPNDSWQAEAEYDRIAIPFDTKWENQLRERERRWHHEVEGEKGAHAERVKPFHDRARRLDPKWGMPPPPTSAVSPPQPAPSPMVVTPMQPPIVPAPPPTRPPIPDNVPAFGPMPVYVPTSATTYADPSRDPRRRPKP